MTNHGMLVCSFNLKKRFSQNEEAVYPLNHLFELECQGDPIEFKNAAEIFGLFCEAKATLTDNEKKQKVFAIKNGSFRKYDEDTYTATYFVIKSGSYGIESDITDKITQEVKYHRNANEPDVKEFHCVIYIPKDVGDLEIKRG